MNKIFKSLITISAVFLIVGCGTKKEDNKLNVISTIFPYYDITSQIIGKEDNINLELLIDNGADLHSYQATTDDIIAINNADIIVLNGGPSDQWILDAIKDSNNKDLIIINAMEELSDNVLAEEHVEGMQEHKHDHEHEEESHEHEHEEESHEHEHEHESSNHNDEHLWLSIKNMKVITKSISKALVKADKDNKSSYEKNTTGYTNELNKLDNNLEKVVNNAKHDSILVGDRFPFRYLVEDYNINYYAAFPGCSGETEASFETIVFLSKKIDELNLDYVLSIDGSDGSIAETIIENTETKSQNVKVLNSMQSLGKKDINKKSYISIMEQNINVIKDVLN